MVQAESKARNRFLISTFLALGSILVFNFLLFMPISSSDWDTTDLISCVRKDNNTPVSCIHQQLGVRQQSKTKEFRLQSVDVVEKTEYEYNSNGKRQTYYQLYLKTDSDPIEVNGYYPKKANEAKAQFDSLLQGKGAAELKIKYGAGLMKILVLSTIQALDVITALIIGLWL
jgi:hypothetical protein